jgi:hypothetical protein
MEKKKLQGVPCFTSCVTKRMKEVVTKYGVWLHRTVIASQEIGELRQGRGESRREKGGLHEEKGEVRQE